VKSYAAMGITHFDEAPTREYELGHIRGRWTMLGEAAGSIDVGLRRIELPAGGWSTPAHEHGLEEEFFYVLRGRGLSWHSGATAEVAAGDCVLYAPKAGAHTVHALEALDLLAFGLRRDDESVGFPRLGMSRVGRRMVRSEPGAVEGAPAQFVHESRLGPPELPPEPGPRPPTIVNIDEVERRVVDRARISRTRRNLGIAVGSVRAGLQHVEVTPGKESAPLHCHSLEEEMFVMLAGDGVLVLGDEEFAVGAGHVVSRPPASRVPHMFRAGQGGLTYLAYGTREPADICYYPRSNKINFGGVGIIARLERLDYWDGED
jgi:uncharacterized cupin superfamily protein